jgi:membrane protein
LVSVQFVDRAAALAGLAFSALVPLLIVYDAVAPTVDRQDFAGDLIDRFDLAGPAAQSVRQALAPPGDVAQSLGVLSLVLVVISALSFARALQRLYERAFGLPALGVRGTPATLLWLVLIPVFVTGTDVLDAIAGGTVPTVLSLAFAAALWTVTPFVLLARRVDWRMLVPAGVLTALAMSLLGTATAIWMPHAVSDSAGRFGVIGIAFALLSWLVAAGFALVASATAGAVIAERRWRST